ncbi:hypothetical protein BDV59DRAFT_137906 [Aspergillus ambiguus]|uniref:transcription factor xanC n=1 Tax=Aspergillus ambiguus TaxID=176160 RepID=UPI003CCE08EC
MRSQSAKDRSTKDEPGQKQDPLERRRVQNRLSQRNHRRKIRDRIAKLQERVIASELRAAASIHSWDYPSPYTPYNYHETPHEENFPSSLQNISSLDSASCLAASGACSFCNDEIIFQSMAPVECAARLQCDGMELGKLEPSMVSTSPNPTSYNSTPTKTSNDPNVSRDIYSAQIWDVQSLSSEHWKTLPLDPAPNIYYATPDTTLPQIIQLLNADPSQSKAIVLIQNTSPRESFIALHQLPLSTDVLESGDLPNTCQPSSRNAGSVHAPQYTDDYQLRMSY